MTQPKSIVQEQRNRRPGRWLTSRQRKNAGGRPGRFCQALPGRMTRTQGTIHHRPAPAALKGMGAAPHAPADVYQDSRSTGWRVCWLPSNSGRGEPPAHPTILLVVVVGRQLP
jgi:hypothetical protein